MPRKKASERNADSLKSHSPTVEPEQVRSTTVCDSFHSTNGEHTMSATSSLNFDSLYAAEEAKNVDDHQRYLNLLRERAAGKTTTSDAEILDILEKVGRSVADLEDDVKWRLGRDKLIVIVREGETHKAKKAEAEAAISKLSNDFERVREQYKKDCWPHECTINAAREGLHWAMVYRSELQRDHRDPNIEHELEKLNARSRSLPSTRHLEEKADSIRREIEFAQQEIDMMPALSPDGKDKVRQIKARIKDRKRDFDRIQEELVDIRVKRDEIERETQGVYERMVFA